MTDYERDCVKSLKAFFKKASPPRKKIRSPGQQTPWGAMVCHQLCRQLPRAHFFHQSSVKQLFPLDFCHQAPIWAESLSNARPFTWSLWWKISCDIFIAGMKSYNQVSLYAISDTVIDIQGQDPVPLLTSRKLYFLVKKHLETEACTSSLSLLAFTLVFRHRRSPLAALMQMGIQ